MQFWAGRSLAILLALSVLAGSVPPLIYSHSHAGGSAPHDHSKNRHQHSKNRHQAGHSHHHGGGHHGHGHHHHHPPAPTIDESRDHLDDSGSHWHVTLLFFDFTFPGLPNPDGESENDGTQLLAVARIVDLSRTLPTENGLARLIGQKSADVNPIAAVAGESAGPNRNLHDARILLCDVARRERSGVLLV